MIQPSSGLLRVEAIDRDPVRLKCTLSLTRLFHPDSERERFEARWLDFFHFLQADPCHRHPEIFQRKGDDLIYYSEQLIPDQKDRRKRKPLLLVLGNPASHSVKAKMFFSYEGKEEEGREHRFWKQILSPALIPDLDLDGKLPNQERNQERNDKRREMLLSSHYDSPYQIGLAVFISFPSPASGDWCGVAGVETLFGKDAMEQIIAAERKRMRDCAQEFLYPHGAVVSFNKLSWNELRSPNNRLYTLERAKHRKLVGQLQLEGNKSIPLFGVPPTRLADQAKKVLSRFAKSHFEPRS